MEKQKSNIQVRIRSHNIITHQPGVKPIKNNALSELETWLLFINNDMLEHIVTCTNKFINKVAGNYSNIWYVKCTNITELKCFIGLLYGWRLAWWKTKLGRILGKR